ncbi:MAG: methionyl-tRNA formyltransferase [Syntrophales bacterium]|nr:methionyl-tRNA formyltransferase [Syntrophales bacterium]PKN60132.1 MAG: methionyl-tRNA formyltransferase [Deltaproteobacteria bacterium HGW-Deltaproteobacteria-11]
MKPKILFMGTPEFAVPSLKILLEQDHCVIGVVTQPDRPKGRGKQPAPPPLKVFAEAHRLPVLQPERVRSPEFLELFRQLTSDLVVVVAFGQILPKEMLERPRLGCINVHPSLLPRYRGAAPLNWTIIRGETHTGVTIMQMDEGMDSGDILLQEKTEIGPCETFGELHDRLAVRGAQLLAEAIGMIVTGEFRRIPQDHAAATFAPKLKKEDGVIRWEADAQTIVRLIRGLSPAPGAHTFFDGKILRIFQAVEIDTPSPTPPGATSISENELMVSTANGMVSLLDVQLEGKKRMPVHEFLRGCRLKPGDRLGTAA